MAIIISTEEELRTLSYEKPYLAVKYHNDKIAYCHELYRNYTRLSEDEKYKDITFVRINADENQIAQKLMEKDVYSFMAIYKNGFLVESRTISDVDDIISLLDELAEMIE
ncbi:MAG: hypothetical protein ACXWDO_10645 [Bacteroidia bacterium]